MERDSSLRPELRSGLRWAILNEMKDLVQNRPSPSRSGGRSEHKFFGRTYT